MCLFTFQPLAKADGHNSPTDDSKTNSKTTNNNDTAGTSSPINNNIAFLIVVGLAISGKLISDKIKSVRQ
jgi:hypothetical protein